MAESAVFDFSNKNRAWLLEVTRKETMSTRAQRKLDAMLADLDVADEDIDAQWAVVHDLLAQRDKLVVQVVRDVPRSWLVTDAPKEIDWSKPESLNYLRADANTSFFEAMQKAMQSPAGK